MKCDLFVRPFFPILVLLQFWFLIKTLSFVFSPSLLFFVSSFTVDSSPSLDCCFQPHQLPEDFACYLKLILFLHNTVAHQREVAKIIINLFKEV